MIVIAKLVHIVILKIIIISLKLKYGYAFLNSVLRSNKYAESIMTRRTCYCCLAGRFSQTWYRCVTDV